MPAELPVLQDLGKWGTEYLPRQHRCTRAGVAPLLSSLPSAHGGAANYPTGGKLERGSLSLSDMYEMISKASTDQAPEPADSEGAGTGRKRAGRIPKASHARTISLLCSKEPELGEGRAGPGHRHQQHTQEPGLG